MAHEPKTALKGGKTGGEYTLALNERHKILGACNSCNWNFGLRFFPGYGFTLLSYKKLKLPLCDFVQVKFLFIFFYFCFLFRFKWMSWKTIKFKLFEVKNWYMLHQLPHYCLFISKRRDLAPLCWCTLYILQ